MTNWCPAGPEEVLSTQKRPGVSSADSKISKLSQRTFFKAPPRGGGGARRSRRPTSSLNLLPPGPPPFISSFIPACLFGVGLKGAGWTRTENDIPTRTTQSRANKRKGAYGCCLDLFVSRYTSEIANCWKSSVVVVSQSETKTEDTPWAGKRRRRTRK